ncbi:MAG: YicC family protein, partial [Psychroflexus sp.]
SSKINTKLVENYISQLQTISSEGDKDFNTLLKIAMSLPEAVSVDKSEMDEAESKAIFEVVETALENINEFRSEEGEVLKKDFQFRIDNLSTLLEDIKKVDPERIQHVKTRLRKGIEDLKENIDENRFEQELIYYIEKYDITEEKTRLDNHLAYFSKTLNSSDSNGKKLNFICQEIGREINTIGSKSNFAPMQKMVVQMKDELEKIKEQLLNVL